MNYVRMMMMPASLVPSYVSMYTSPFHVTPTLEHNTLSRIRDVGEAKKRRKVSLVHFHRARDLMVRKTNERIGLESGISKRTHASQNVDVIRRRIRVAMSQIGFVRLWSLVLP